MSMIQFDRVTFAYEGGHIPVFENLTLRLDTSWKLGMVGRNGRGKTTLLRLLAGEEEYRGTILNPVQGRRFPCTVQHPEWPVAQVLSEAAPGAEPWQLQRELSLLGLGGEVMERTFSTLSGGEQSRVLLSALFLDKNCYPMLDEPTDHLDGQGRKLVAQYLRRTDRGFLLVSHDRALLDQCADHILALNKTGQELVKGSFSAWYKEKQDRDRREQAENQRLRGEIKRLQEAADQSAVWSGQVEASKRGTRNSGLRPDRGYLGHKAAKMMKRAKTIDARRQKAAEEKNALLKDVEHSQTLKIAPAVHHSKRLLELKGVSVDYGRGAVCRDISFTLEQGERVCLNGKNGSGKTSMLRLILGEDIPHTGSVWRTSGLKISYLSQKADYLKGQLRAFPEREGVDAAQFMTVLRKLDFPREAFEMDMACYSSGQKKKVLLAASLCQSAHLYLWDEPLNFIDLFSRIQLEELILAYQPTVLFVEHDQMFREKIATKNIVL